MLEELIKNKILEKAISLQQFGLNDLAWKKEEAKKLIVSLMSDNIGILGGDVYKIDSKRLIPTYDNWSSEPGKGEDIKEYFSRSKLVALDYINKYPVDNNEDIVFSIVFNEVID